MSTSAASIGSMTLATGSAANEGNGIDGASTGADDANNAASPQPLLPSRCAANCTQYGTCNEELGRCDCPLGRRGADCSVEVENPSAVCAKYGHTSVTCFRSDYASCINGCNFRGKCIGGFCHCKPGFYGTDCSLSLDAAGVPVLLAGQGYVARRSGPRIYVYELPPHINTWHNVERLDRPLMAMLHQRLLSAGLRVADPKQADYFFVPVRARLSYDSAKVRDALAYVRATWPFWNATGGAGHLLVHTGDWGRDELADDVSFLTRNATWLTHWGLARDHEFAKWKASHRPGRDVVLPLFLQQALLSAYRLTRSPMHPAAAPRARRVTLFFAGRVCGSRAEPLANGSYPICPSVMGREDAYSAATRQRAYFYHHNRTGWKVVTHTRTYAADMATAKFCLAPSGGGQGKRSVTSVLMGCIPVTVTDGLLQPFEPELHWDEFSVDIRERELGVMHQLLERLDGQQVAEFQSRLRCAAQHLFWSSLYGGLFGEDGRYDAFETLVQVLRMRLRYPLLGPEEYAYVDPEFDAFMRCQLPPGTLPGQEPEQEEEGGRAGGARAAGASAPVVVPVASHLAPLRVAFSSLGPGSGTPLRQELCSHSDLAGAGGGAATAPQCNRCRLRRGRLLNPGGTICCNTKELAKCPRLWD